MKVCILSMQRVQNFGSLLQSYALKKLLEELGCEVRFIDIEPNADDDRLVLQNRLDFKNEHEQKGLLQKLRKIDRYTLNRLRIKRISKKQDILFEKFRSEVLCIKETDNFEQYDLCIIGSDEVFNCLSRTKWGFTTQLFGNVRQSERVITYAASCGATTVLQMNPAMLAAITNAFKRISAFSARDINTGSLISALTEQPVEYHLDPVWVADFSNEIDRAKVSVKLPQKYCVVYSYYNRIYHRDEISAIKAFCKEHNLEPIALGAPQMWIKKYVAVSPIEILKIIQNADFVITDTFHGTIFSEKYNGRYAVLLRESNTNKLSDLVERLGLHDHVIDSFRHLNGAYDVFGCREHSKIMQQAERIRSLEYLKTNVSNAIEE